MALFLSMLPLYLFGNFHCAGMCGPLVFMIGRHKFRYFYFFGRMLSFGFAGALAGGVGEVLNLFLRIYQIPAMTSLLFGAVILGIGLFSLTGFQLPGKSFFEKRLVKFTKPLSLLILQDRAAATFLFGFFTVFLPCGQTAVVFSACALFGDPFIGFGNGFAFACLTSPSLLFAMHTHHLFKSLRMYYNVVMGLLAVPIGILAVLRGFAELDLIQHWILNPNSPVEYHIVAF